MRELCFKCLRPKEFCYCTYISPVDAGIKFVFLMHPKEAKRQRTGTGRLAALSLPKSEIITGVDFSKNERVNSLLSDETYYPVLLYPAENAWTSTREGFQEAVGGRTLLVFLVDSTWACSKKIIKSSVNLQKLPKLSFSGNYKSIFTFKHEPKDYCVSTIESCYYLIKELQAIGMADAAANPEPLMAVFKKLIQFQLQKENERIQSGIPGSHAYDWKYTKLREIPSL